MARSRFQDGHVQRAHFAAAQVDNFRAARQQFASGLEIAALDGFMQLFRR